MAESEQLIYPQSQLAMGSGDLVDVTNFNMTLTNNAKQKHTLRRTGAGISWGVIESNVSFDAILSEEGEERDFWGLVQSKVIKQLRAKIPGGRVLVVNGAYKDCNLDAPIDDATKISCTFIGKQKKD